MKWRWRFVLWTLGIGLPVTSLVWAKFAGPNWTGGEWILWSFGTFGTEVFFLGAGSYGLTPALKALREGKKEG